MPTQNVKPPKCYITKYFESMSSETPTIYTPKEECRHDTIVVQQEQNATECKDLNEDSLGEID